MNLLLDNVYTHVSCELTEVDDLIAGCVTGKESTPLLSEICGCVLGKAGKRLRPALVLLAGKCCRGSKKRLVHLAAALELIHMASLVHDDIIDKGMLRRGNTTVNARWGNHVAVLLGDYFYARALELAAPLGARINTGLAELVGDLVRGEFRQLENRHRHDMTEVDYLNTVSCKTAQFISLCCRLGAELGKSSPQMVNGLSLYGFYTGMAYQITDDVLDVTGRESVTGKSRGQDLTSGVITLPVIHALNNGPDRDQMKKLLIKERLTARETKAIIQFIRLTGSVEYSLGKARDFIGKAKGSLQDIPAGKARDALGLLAEYICQRVS